ncbi:hypothetical protein SAMN05661091_4087 [Paenibacillus uliginis N3/975]|uniref:Uncharacterized protein n=1 Tax=Paenibacillus uliginis N3/975 TaxID=1313296 RepID=A0A1X7HJY2_9BACL|nr:hypothetical protein [Paenibacillus uliginis]SMF88055.1 hypothetical protein SAMN05661091_4087 [Paenibacillus uliginis N3/975]
MLVLDLFVMLLGLFVTVLAFLFLLKPDSDWVRWIKKIPEDVTLDDADLLRFRIIGLLNIGVGAALIVGSILKIFVW